MGCRFVGRSEPAILGSAPTFVNETNHLHEEILHRRERANARRAEEVGGLRGACDHRPQGGHAPGCHGEGRCGDRAAALVPEATRADGQPAHAAAGTVRVGSARGRRFRNQPRRCDTGAPAGHGSAGRGPRSRTSAHCGADRPVREECAPDLEASRFHRRGGSACAPREGERETDGGSIASSARRSNPVAARTLARRPRAGCAAADDL